jgi:hypothetical protein
MLAWINWMGYGFGALMINAFGDIYTMVYGNAYPYLTCNYNDMCRLAWIL